MAYIGKEPIVGNFQKCDAITVVNGQAAYTLQVSSTNVVPESANHMLVSLNGILQAPITSFSVSSSTLTFASNLATGDVIDFVILLGNVLDLGTPSDGTVTNAKLASDVISGETDIGGALADADLLLVDDGAGGTLRKSALSRMKTYIGGGITMADAWRINSNFANSSGAADITANWERVDTDGFGTIGSALSESSGIFTFPSTGIYLITTQAYMSSGAALAYAGVMIKTTTDNSTYAVASETYQTTSASGNNLSTNASFIFDVTNTTNDKFKLSVQNNASCTYSGSTGQTLTGVSVIRLGDT